MQAVALAKDGNGCEPLLGLQHGQQKQWKDIGAAGGPGRAWEGLRLSQLTRCTSRGMGTTTSSPLAALSAPNSGLILMLMFACAHIRLPWTAALCFRHCRGRQVLLSLQLAGSQGHW